VLDDAAFVDLLDRVRARDEQAAADLVRLYEPELRRIIRVRLGGAHLRRLLDSVDVCQSVFSNFFARASAGQFELASSEQLVKLLATMACNRVNDLYRKQQAARRVDRHLESWDRAHLERLAAPGPAPGHQAAVRELYESVRRLLSDEERYLAEQRGLGRDWAEIAAELNDSPEALRKRLPRALDRAARQLGLDAFDES
jgi:DNA-directed RNA polymerase specialized sigma24 family protein